MNRDSKPLVRSFLAFLLTAFLCLQLSAQQTDSKLTDSGTKTPKDKLAAIQAKLDLAVKQLHADSSFPGCSVSIVLPYGDVITATAGFADKENEIAIKASDRMMSASIGKTYFAATAARLIRDGKLSLEDKVSKHLGDHDGFERIPNSADISIAHIMRHQSGIPRYIFNRQVWKDATTDPDLQWNDGDQLKYVYDAKPLHPVGEGWAYSDTNYILLGLVIQKITGQSVYDIVQSQLLKPNGLNDTIPNDRRELPGLVQGHSTSFKGFGVPAEVVKNGKFVFNPQMEWCGGGFLCTSSDLARWAHIYFSGNAFDGDYVTILTSDAADSSRMLGPTSRYGLGVIIRDTSLGTALGHDGGFPGYSSTMAYFPDRKIAAAFMYNTDTRGAISKPAAKLMVELVESALAK